MLEFRGYIFAKGIHVHNSSRLIRLTLYVCLSLCFTTLAEEREIVVFPNMDGRGTSHHGYQILSLALTCSDKKYRLKLSDSAMNDERARLSLKSKLIDVADFGYSVSSEDELKPIYFPIDLGLSGVRVVLAPEHSDLLKSNNLDLLRIQVAGLGKYWAEESIWRTADLPYYTAPNLDSLYSMVLKRRIDYLPLGVNEVMDFLNKRLPISNSLSIHNSMLIKYRLARMFFVHPDSQELAKQIRIGLDRLYKSGLLTKELTEITELKQVQDLLDLSQLQVIELDNPSFSPALQHIPKEYFEQFELLKF